MCIHAYIFREILSINKDSFLKSINKFTFVLEAQCLHEVGNEILSVRRYIKNKIMNALY